MACSLFGCQNKSEEPGIIARVNGNQLPEQLEYKYDLTHEGVGGFVPSVEQVRAEYGQILGDLIVQELVAQELEQREIPVSDKELKEAEDEVRSDYPDDSFEQILIEEYIDINAWRSQLKYQLAMDKFFKDILRLRSRLITRKLRNITAPTFPIFTCPPGTNL